ncbi:MAG: UDP-3-O-(3-hydroxymyristoyl)glucosamine N-acyltransferase [Zavarzinella sp.]
MKVTFTVRELAAWVEGEVLGNPELAIHAARPLTEMLAPTDITVVLSEKNLPQLHGSKAGAAVVDETVPLNGKTLVRVKDPLLAFATIFERMHVKPTRKSTGIHHLAVVDPTAIVGDHSSVAQFSSIGEGTVIGPGAEISANVTIGNHCQIGSEVFLAPGVVLYDGCIIGDRVRIHANSVIGGDGFGYRMISGKHCKIPHVGHVEIGNDVEIGAGVTIDRATFGATRIGEGTKIDNLVMIAHNCQIGRHNLIVSQVGLAGSCSTGDYVVLAGQVGAADHTTVGDYTVVGAKSGISGKIPSNQKLLGAPATPINDQKRIMVSLSKLPDMRRDLDEIKRILGLKDS